MRVWVLVYRLSVVRIGQELFLIGHDLRESVRRDLTPVLLRETGSDVLIKQSDHMIETGRRFTNRW